MDDEDLLGGWAAAVNRIVRGDSLRRPQVFLGATPEVLQRHGLNSGALGMMVAKVARCRREHPEVPLHVWHQLPDLLKVPLAIFPSARRDGSLVTLLLVQDSEGNHVVVVAAPAQGNLNVVLSVYGKHDCIAWAAKEIARAKSDGLPVYESEGFAATLPQPPVAEATSSSHGPIPSDGTAKPKRLILKLR